MQLNTNFSTTITLWNKNNSVNVEKSVFVVVRILCFENEIHLQDYKYLEMLFSKVLENLGQKLY